VADGLVIWRATCEPSRTTDVVPAGRRGRQQASASSAPQVPTHQGKVPDEFESGARVLAAVAAGYERCWRRVVGRSRRDAGSGLQDGLHEERPSLETNTVRSRRNPRAAVAAMIRCRSAWLGGCDEEIHFSLRPTAKGSSLYGVS